MGTTGLRDRIAEWRRRDGWWLESGGALLTANVVHAFGLAAPGRTIWALDVVLMLCALTGHPRVQAWLCGGGRTTGLPVWRGAAILVALTALAIYLTGWGPLLGIGYVTLASLLLREAGSYTWRPVLACTVVATVIGQAGVALGWLESYLPNSAAQAIGVLGTVTAVMAIQALGQATAEREGEAAERELAEQAVRDSEERFRALVQDSSDVVAVTDPEGQITYVSGAVEHVMGYRPEEYRRLNGADLIHPEDLPGMAAMAGVLQDGADGYRTEMRIRHADGTWHWHEVQVRNLMDNPAVRGMVYNHRDITERKEYQQRLAYEARHDALTGLVNRAALWEALDAVCHRPSGEPAVVLYLDLDGFKRINDELGHEAGDELLRITARGLRACVLGGDTVARLGGDEFAVLLGDIHSVDNAVVVAERIIERLHEPVLLGGHQITARASIGLALCTPGTIDATEALRRADVAMYRAKREKTKGWQLYVEGMQDRRTAAAALEDDLRHALDTDQLAVHYQPIVELDGGRLTGVEALVRWHHPTRGALPPATFIPLAEETGLIAQLGATVLRTACAQLREWRDRWPYGPGLTLSVNLSPRQLERQTLVAEVQEVLAATGVSPRDVVLELTESATMDTETICARLRDLADLGLRIALDDFGTGYSSLSYLTDLPVDLLKIDRRFVARLDGTAPSAAVVEAVIRLGHALHLEVIAEGVETAEQAAELQLRGCRTAQGYHLGRPLDPGAMTALIAAQRKRPGRADRVRGWR